MPVSRAYLPSMERSIFFFFFPASPIVLSFFRTFPRQQLLCTRPHVPDWSHWSILENRYSLQFSIEFLIAKSVLHVVFQLQLTNNRLFACIGSISTFNFFFFFFLNVCFFLSLYRFQFDLFLLKARTKINTCLSALRYRPVACLVFIFL